jgi:hypothetical protein
MWKNERGRVPSTPRRNVTCIFIAAQWLAALRTRNHQPDDHVRGFYCQAGPLSVIVIV